MTAMLESGEAVTVRAVRVFGEPGSLGICAGVEITSIRNAAGVEVDVTDEELRALQLEAEKHA